MSPQPAPGRASAELPASVGAPSELPATVLALIELSATCWHWGGRASLTDCSSEAIYPILSVFVRGLGGTGMEIGLIDGLANAVAAVVRLPSGIVSDAVGRRPGA